MEKKGISNRFGPLDDDTHRQPDIASRFEADSAALQDGFDKLSLIRAAEELNEMVFAMAGVATGLWRMRKRLIKPNSDQPAEEMRLTFHHLESSWEALTSAGIEIQDHTDSPFDSGMSLSVVAFEPLSGICKEKVLETIKPSIYYKGRMIQMGEVIVAIPEGSAGGNRTLAE